MPVGATVDLTGTRAPAPGPAPHPWTGDAFVTVPTVLEGLSGQTSVPRGESGLPQHVGAAADRPLPGAG